MPETSGSIRSSSTRSGRCSATAVSASRPAADDDRGVAGLPEVVGQHLLQVLLVFDDENARHGRLGEGSTTLPPFRDIDPKTSPGGGGSGVPRGWASGQGEVGSGRQRHGDDQPAIQGRPRLSLDSSSRSGRRDSEHGDSRSGVVGIQKRLLVVDAGAGAGRRVHEERGARARARGGAAAPAPAPVVRDAASDVGDAATDAADARGGARKGGRNRDRRCRRRGRRLARRGQPVARRRRQDRPRRSIPSCAPASRRRTRRARGRRAACPSR